MTSGPTPASPEGENESPFWQLSPPEKTPSSPTVDGVISSPDTAAATASSTRESAVLDVTSKTHQDHRGDMMRTNSSAELLLEGPSVTAASQAKLLKSKTYENLIDEIRRTSKLVGPTSGGDENCKNSEDNEGQHGNGAKADPHGNLKAQRSYDFSKSTNENHCVPGSRDVCGPFKDIRAELDFDYHGCYNLRRQKIQDIIINDTIGAGTRKQHPWLIFTAGAMGAGKGHTIEWMSKMGFFPLPDMVRVDPDKFRSELPEWMGYLTYDKGTAGSKTHRESGYCVEIAQEAAMLDSKNVWVDGSLRDWKWYEFVFKGIRERHPRYRIALIHVFAPWDIVLERATKRADLTGRVVPLADLKKSFEQVPISVEKLMKHVDFSAHVDNGASEEPRIVMDCVGDACNINQMNDWESVRRRFAALPVLNSNNSETNMGSPEGGSTNDLQTRSREYIATLVKTHKILIFSKTYCSYCVEVKKVLMETLEEMKLEEQYDDATIRIVELDSDDHPEFVENPQGGENVALQIELSQKTGQDTVPVVFFGGEFIGGCSDVLKLKSQGKLREKLSKL